LKTLLPLLLLSLLLSGCLSYKDIVNFQDGQDLGDGRLDSIANFARWTIQPEDIVQVTVSSSNMEAAQQFNIIDSRTVMQMQMQAGGGGRTLSEPIGYRVDTDGFIDIPVIGRVEAHGKTVEELKRDIFQRVEATQYLPDVNIQVMYLSFRITILGEVNAPGSYIIQSQKMNVLEAIGLANDLNLFANRDNILVIREKEGLRSYGRINLKSKSLFESPYFYLQPNDIIYVEPHKAKILAAPDPASRYVSTIVGVITLATLIVTITSSN
jgi:polysaccharide export outer membrane protein